MKDGFESNNNYALMIYDKKKEAFRLVPIQKHIYFEKQRNLVPKVATAQTKQPIVEQPGPEIPANQRLAHISA